MEFTKDQLDAARAFLAQVRERADIGREECWESYQSWARGGRTWSCVYGFGGTDVQTVLWWYQWRCKPTSKEWRPIIILRALVQAAERDYVEPGRMSPDPAALSASHIQKKRARILFIRKRGFETFRRKVQPILRRGGTKALFTAPATSELREYVEILSGLASKTV